MNKYQTFQEYLTTQSAQIPIISFLVNLILAVILAYILGRVYTKYGRTLSNRKDFANNFILLVMTTMVIISIVKSSLALSLGLVGALSIVRFRAAIKEPEELTFLFFAISIGLGLGANQTVIVLIAFVVIVVVIWLKHFSNKTHETQNLFLTISSNDSKKIELSEIITVLKKYCSEVNLKRLDETSEILEASFLVGFDSYSQLEESKSNLQKLNNSIRITFLDNKGIGS